MSLTGAILGDIAGSFYEFLEEIPDWESCEFFREDSVFTDDTVQNLAVGLAVISDKDYEKSIHKICKKYLYVGYGGNFQKWLRNSDENKGNSWANGSSMRVAVIGEWADNLEEAEQMAIDSAICTHNSEEGKKGAKAIAGCIYLAKSGATKDEIQKYAEKLYTEEEYEYYPGRPLKEYRSNYQFEVSCAKSVPVAIRCFLESNDFKSCIRNVFYMNGDTDTLASMAGAIAGSYYGLEEFDCDLLMKQYLDDELYGYWEKIISEIKKKRICKNEGLCNFSR